MVPGHGEGGDGAGRSAHGGAAFGVLGQSEAVVLFHRRQQFAFHPVGIAVAHGVVFQAALRTLGVAAAAVGQDHHHGGNAPGRDHVVQDVGHALDVAMAVLHHHEGRVRCHPLGDIDPDMALVGTGRRNAARRHDIVAIHVALHVGDAHDAGIDLAVGGIEDEFADLALRHGRVGNAFRRIGIVRADDAVLGGHRRRRRGKLLHRRRWGLRQGGPRHAKEQHQRAHGHFSG